jgi:hypothetical protein
MTYRLLLTGLVTFAIGCKDKPKQETFKVDGQSVNATTATEDNYEYELSDLTTEQVDFLRQDLNFAKQLVSKYLKKTVDNPFDPKTLDLVLEEWSKSTADKESIEEVVDAIGGAFGQGIVDELDFEWKIIRDQQGTDRIVIHKKYVINGFPYSSVQKIATEVNPRSLADIKLLLKSQVETADRTGEIDLRK